MLQANLLLPSSWLRLPLIPKLWYCSSKIHGVTPLRREYWGRSIEQHRTKLWRSFLFTVPVKEGRIFQRRPSYYLKSLLFGKYFKNFEASSFFIKILLRHEKGWDSVNNRSIHPLVLEFSFYGWTEVYSPLKMQEQATHKTSLHDKLPVKRRHALVPSLFLPAQTRINTAFLQQWCLVRL
jgi:hypothetical protein